MDMALVTEDNLIWFSRWNPTSVMFQCGYSYQSSCLVTGQGPGAEGGEAWGKPPPAGVYRKTVTIPVMWQCSLQPHHRGEESCHNDQAPQSYPGLPSLSAHIPNGTFTHCWSWIARLFGAGVSFAHSTVSALSLDGSKSLDVA